MKNKKTFLWLALIAVAAVSAYSQQYNAESDFEVVEGEGGGVIITKYLGSKKEVNIPPSIQNSPVTSIGWAFSGNKNITSVIIPNGVTTIEYTAFQDCEKLTSVTIPDSVTSIEGNAFLGCKSLTSVTIPASVKSIGGDAFLDCPSLTSVTFQGKITSSNLSTSTGFPGAYPVFDGDLRAKYLAGGPGTYTRPNGKSTTWTKK